jgi:hypothetical protein
LKETHQTTHSFIADDDYFCLVAFLSVYKTSLFFYISVKLFHFFFYFFYGDNALSAVAAVLIAVDLLTQPACGVGVKVSTPAFGAD